jgi:hypothetical protein
LLHHSRQVRRLPSACLFVRLGQAGNHLTVLVLALGQVGGELVEPLLQSLHL